ncbi:hypothetical protein GGI12_003495 [Dipsacomyces acuminosporus]|nr:hypothetical protein GGI12_003495 [Dipsacomyces acuminosporus]
MYRVGFQDDYDDELYRENEGSSSSNSGSEDIDSDVEEKILSHLYYQSGQNATSAALHARQPSDKARADSGAIEIIDATQSSCRAKTNAVPQSSNSPAQPSSKVSEESKYQIKPKQRNRTSPSDFANSTSNGNSGSSSDNDNDNNDSDSDNDSDNDDGDGDGDGNDDAKRSISITVVPAFRSATNSDDEDVDTISISVDSGTGNASDVISGDLSFNANDDSTNDDYLDSVAHSGLVTPMTPTRSTIGTISEEPMKRQLIQIDNLLSPHGPSTPAPSAMAHTISAKRPRDPEDGEYDYLDEAEFQGKNRYFMEEEEIICRKCHKPGHIAKDCTTVTCMVCGKEGHETKDCKLRGTVCHRCNMRGHVASECPSRSGKHSRYASFCERCSSRDHHSEECSTIWRRYVYTHPPPKKYNSVEPYCYNCSAKGHFGDECSKPIRGVNSFMGDTAFNSENCPGSCGQPPAKHTRRSNGYSERHSGSRSSSSYRDRDSNRSRYGNPAPNREERRRESGYHSSRSRKKGSSNSRQQPGPGAPYKYPGRDSTRSSSRRSSSRR